MQWDLLSIAALHLPQPQHTLLLPHDLTKYNTLVRWVADVVLCLDVVHPLLTATETRAFIVGSASLFIPELPF